MLRVRDDGPGFTSRVPEMAVYGAVVNTAVTHLLLKCLRVILDKLWRWTRWGTSMKLILAFIVVRSEFPVADVTMNSPYGLN